MKNLGALKEEIRYNSDNYLYDGNLVLAVREDKILGVGSGPK